jgi:hypothetical protein
MSAPRRCPCGCYPEVVEYTSTSFCDLAQVGCDCCGRCTFRHEATPDMGARDRAVGVWNELVAQADAGTPWPEPRGTWRFRRRSEASPQ